MEELREIEEVMEMLAEIIPTTNKWTRAGIGSFLGMLMEEWCKVNDDDINKFVNDMVEVVRQIQEECGKY